jgi:hypothetical protein
MLCDLGLEDGQPRSDYVIADLEFDRPISDHICLPCVVNVVFNLSFSYNLDQVAIGSLNLGSPQVLTI